MVLIREVFAREILDSRGLPTVEVDVMLENGIVGRASVPSGASTGSFEAWELRDGNVKRFHGKGVRQAVHSVNTIFAPELIGWDVSQQRLIDQFLIDREGTPQKTQLGANSLLGISLAVAKAAALHNERPLFQWIGGLRAHLLPVPMLNVINGGCHADNSLDFQEFMIVPVGMSSFSDAIQAGSEIFHALKKRLKASGYSTNVGDEGGFAPDFSSPEKALDQISEAVVEAGYCWQTQIRFALDIAATELYQEGSYRIQGQIYSSSQLVQFYEKLVRNYPIFSIEDGMAEEDWEGWKELTQTLGSSLQLVGDDLFVTHSGRLQKGVEKEVANAILIKPNQIGTLSETLDTIQVAQQNGYQCIISHRSGETDDTFISDLAVAVNSGQIKTGSICRGERITKYNQLLRIEQALGTQGRYGLC
jgi:enolase